MADQLNSLVLKYWQQLLSSNYWHEYLTYVNNLTPHQIAILTVVAAILLAAYVYKKFGVSAVSVLLIVYLIYYTVFYSNLFNNWQKDKMEEDRRMQIYQVEMQKK
jgi:hypothetical protein